CHGRGQSCDEYYCESCTCPQYGMTLFNGICDNCIYGAGMPIICTACGGIVRSGLCLPCDFREKNLYNCDPNAYSFDNSNYFLQSQYENHLCNLCGNNSHDGYDCQQQFPFVYEQEPSYNQNYDDNYYPHESPSFPCSDYCGGSHGLFSVNPITKILNFPCHGCGQPCDGYYCESCTCPQCGRTLFNGICDNCIYGAGMPIICTACGGVVRGRLCLPCDFREKNLYNCDPNAYSFDNSNYFPQSQYENHLCNLRGNNSHDGYDCQQQFLFVYEQELSYNQNYDDNYYPHESLSFPCCDYYRGSRETFQCQPHNQNVDFSGSDQIQTPQYPDVNPSSPKISNKEIFQAKGYLMKSIQTFLERFNCIPFEEKPQILFQTRETFFAIQYSQLEDSNELFQKLLKDLKKLVEYDQSTSTNRLIFLNGDEGHSVQDKEEPENSLSMGYEHLSINPKTKVTESNAKNLLPILSECEVTLGDKRECDELICENSSTVDVCDHSEILFDSNNDDLSSDDESFEEIEYVDASIPDPKIASEEENTVQHDEEQEEVDLEDISHVQDVVLREKLFSINRLIANIEFLNDKPTPVYVFNSSTSIPILEESDNSLSLPEFEIIYD
nr:hypothetical protein [Tanacetum cinerariifolium]